MPKIHCSLEEIEARLGNRSAENATDASGNSRTLSEREEIEAINLLAESIAKETGMWIPYSEAMAMGVPAPSGVENDVFFDQNTNTVVKINNLMISKSVLGLIRRILMHNNIFPHTRYSLEGFTGFGNGSIYPILRQDYVTDATYATHGEILDYMEALGFTQNGEASFTNGGITIKDLRPRNVLKNKEGALFVIDADFLENECVSYQPNRKNG